MKTKLIIICAAALLGGCTTYKQKFGKGTVADIGFFADSTVTMMGSLDLQMGRNEALLTRRFFNMEDSEEQAVVKLDTEFQATLHGLMEYSIKIVSIAESGRGDLEMVEAYADYLDQFRETMLEHELIDSSSFDRTVRDVREQEHFLNALRTAQPLLNAVAMNSILSVDELQDAVMVLVKKVDLKIDEEYADIARYRSTTLENEKSDILKAFEIIYTAYRAEEPELSALRESGVIWTPEIIPEGRPSREDLGKIGDHLEARMNAMHRIHQEIEPDWNDYLETQRELKTITKRSMTMIQQTQIIMLTWVRAHRKMADGTSDPADWFDIGESTKALLKTAPRAVL